MAVKFFKLKKKKIGGKTFHLPAPEGPITAVTRPCIMVPVTPAKTFFPPGSSKPNSLNSKSIVKSGGLSPVAFFGAIYRSIRNFVKIIKNLKIISENF